jgi:hypothetical protein
MSDIENNGLKVMNALTNSYAYQCYNKSIESIKKNCESDYKDNIEAIDKYIEQSIANGYTKDKFNFSYYPTYEIKGKYYMTKVELSNLIKYYEDKGFIIKFKIRNGLLNTLFKFKLKQMAGVKIYISWDFSNK